jgi:hypothetical protein
VVTNLKGDTLKTLMGKGGPGMHHVTWDMKAKPPKPTPLTPAGRRDSLVTARKLDHVFDSLTKANVAPKPVLERIRESFESGTVGELFQQVSAGGGGNGKFAERPGESALPKHHGAAADTAKKTGAEAGGEGESESGLTQEVLGEVAGAVRASKAITGGFFGGRNAALVESGDYLVTMSAGGTTQRQVLRVEKSDGANGSAAGGDEEDPFDP